MDNSNQIAIKKPIRVSDFPRLALVMFALVISSYLCQPITQPSYFGHLAVGNWITSAHAVPRENLWTQLGNHSPWLDESCLFDAVLSVVEEHFGENGISALKLLLFFAVAATLSFLFVRRSENNFFGGLIALLVCCGVLEQMSLEPELGAIVCFCCLLLLREFGLRGWLGLTAFAVVAVATNIHVSVLLGALFLFLPLPNPHSRASSQLAKLASLLALAASPYTVLHLWQGISASFVEAKHALYFRHLTLNVFDFGFCFLIFLWMFVACLAVTAKDRRISLEDLVAGFLSLFALAFSPFLPFALIATGLTASSLASANATSQSNLLQASRQLASRLGRLPLNGSVFLLLCLAFTLSVQLFRNPIVDAGLPRKALDYLQENNLPEPLFHERDIAPYVIYRFSDVAGRPRRLAAFDEKLDGFDPELARSEKALREWNVGWEKVFTAVTPRTVLCRTYTPLYEALRRDGEWKLVFEGDGTIAEVPEHKPLPYSWALFVRR